MIRIISVGKIKEKFYEDAVSEYAKRLSAYTKLDFFQVDDEKCPENLSEKEAEAVREKEGERILAGIKDRDFDITLEIKGKALTSEEFSKTIEDLQITGHSNITFVIGGSIGLAGSVLKRSDMSLSFSAFTFPHQLMKVILLEQIYRAFKIMKDEPYHK